MPVLVLAGAADAVVPIEESVRTVDLIPGALLETFANAGHMLPIECSDEVAERILGLSAEIEDRSG